MRIIADSVALVMPCSVNVEPRVVQSAIGLGAFATANGFTVRHVGITERTVVHTARNFLAKAFVESDCEWCFWMDSDMILEPRTIPVMIKWTKQLGGKLATGIYYQRMGSCKPLVFIRDPIDLEGKPLHTDRMPEDYSHTHVIHADEQMQPFKIDAAGFGCFLTHRTVIEAMKDPYFKNCFLESGKEISEDFYFCIKARQLGYDIWAVPELDCGHIGSAPVITRKQFKRPESEMVAIQVETVKPQEGAYHLEKIEGGKIA